MFSALTLGELVTIFIERLAKLSFSRERWECIHVGIKLIEMLTLLLQLVFEGTESIEGVSWLAVCYLVSLGRGGRCQLLGVVDTHFSISFCLTNIFSWEDSLLVHASLLPERHNSQLSIISMDQFWVHPSASNHASYIKQRRRLTRMRGEATYADATPPGLGAPVSPSPILTTGAAENDRYAERRFARSTGRMD